MFIPDPGSEFFPSPIPIKGQRDSQIRIKEFKYFNPKNCFLALGNMIRDVHPRSGSRIRILSFLPIPDPGIKKRHRIPDPDPQHWSRPGTCFLGVKTSGIIFLVGFSLETPPSPPPPPPSRRGGIEPGRWQGGGGLLST